MNKIILLAIGLPVSIILDYLQCYCVITGTESLFSEAGMLLTKQRKRMSPKVMKKLVYIRCEKKYRKWMERLGISISEEELKKGTEEDRADGHEDEVQDDDLADY